MEKQSKRGAFVARANAAGKSPAEMILDAIEAHGTLHSACKALGINPNTARHHLARAGYVWQPGRIVKAR